MNEIKFLPPEEIGREWGPIPDQYNYVIMEEDIELGFISLKIENRVAIISDLLVHEENNITKILREIEKKCNEDDLVKILVYIKSTNIAPSIWKENGYTQSDSVQFVWIKTLNPSIRD